jgi:hypothetical protein
MDGMVERSIEDPSVGYREYRNVILQVNIHYAARSESDHRHMRSKGKREKGVLRSFARKKGLAAEFVTCCAARISSAETIQVTHRHIYPDTVQGYPDSFSR